jgi:lipopolysaccharide transport system permease protein
MSADSDSVLIIEPTSSWRGIDLGEVWRYRELLYFFVWRDVKVRYKQTALGVTWAVIQPLFAMVIFAFFFGRIAKLPSDGVPYPLFTYAGLLPWTFFANALTSGSQSLLGSAHLVSKVFFPRILVPVSAVTTTLIDFGFALLMLAPLLLWHGQVPSAAALLGIPLAMLVAYLLVLGLSIWLSALVVAFRDLRHVIPFVTQIWMFATPIVYSLSLVPPQWRPLVLLNPMVSVVETFRNSLFGRPMPLGGLAWSAVLAIVLIVTGSIYFRRLERSFVDVM